MQLNYAEFVKKVQEFMDLHDYTEDHYVVEQEDYDKMQEIIDYFTEGEDNVS